MNFIQRSFHLKLQFGTRKLCSSNEVVSTHLQRQTQIQQVIDKAITFHPPPTSVAVYSSCIPQRSTWWNILAVFIFPGSVCRVDVQSVRRNVRDAQLHQRITKYVLYSQKNVTFFFVSFVHQSKVHSREAVNTVCCTRWAQSLMKDKESPGWFV